MISEFVYADLIAFAAGPQLSPLSAFEIELNILRGALRRRRFCFLLSLALTSSGNA